MIADQEGRAAISAPRTVTYRGGGGGGRGGGVGGGGGEKGAPPTTNDERLRDAVCVCRMSDDQKQTTMLTAISHLSGRLPTFCLLQVGHVKERENVDSFIINFTAAHFCHDIILCTLESCGACRRLEGDRASGRVFPFFWIKKQPCFSL